MEQDIKIFVSHRIDIESEPVENSIYVPVRCGAVFDKDNPMQMAGDDTGDNISDKRLSFCEFTVQYWAWNNVDADYYGLCHYRRYLSFAEKRFRPGGYNMIQRPVLTKAEIKRFCLSDVKQIARIVRENDAVVSEYADVRKMSSPKGLVKSVKEMWDAYEGEFYKNTPTDWILEQIDKKASKYSQSAREYYAGTKHRGFCCYVLKRELFERLCEFQFPILFEAEKHFINRNTIPTMRRTPGFVGEILYGIFIYHLEHYEDCRIKSQQLVYFHNTKRIRNKMDLCRGYIRYVKDQGGRLLVDPIIPPGTRRREFLKRVLL